MKCIRLLNVFLLTVCGCLNGAEELPMLYRDLDVLPFDNHGWYGNAEQMENLFNSNPGIKVVIEIGSWLGSSTRHIASLVPDDGMVYAVDHWLGSSEHQPGNPTWYEALPYLYQQFLSNVIHAGLTHKVTPVRMGSLEAAKALKNIQPDLIYVDGSHDSISLYNDLEAWFPFVKGNGVMCGDDWRWGHSRDVIGRFAEENNLKIVVPNEADGGNFWYFQE